MFFSLGFCDEKLKVGRIGLLADTIFRVYIHVVTLLAFHIGANSERKFVPGNDSSSLVASFIPAGHVARSARATPRAR